MSTARTTYTHGHAEPVLRSHAWRTATNSAPHLLPHLRPDQRLLDVGAGPGTITVDLATHVARTTATEIDDAALALTRATADAAGADIELVVADVHDLPFDDDTFDVTHAHQVLQHVVDPVTALAQMARVTRPGGVVAVRDADYAAMHWYPRLPELDEWQALHRAAARAAGGEPDAGRHLRAWARAAGLSDIAYTATTWVYATDEERAWWGGLWADRVTGTDLARRIVDGGLATAADLDRVAAGWRRWAADPDGWFAVPNAEVIARP